MRRTWQRQVVVGDRTINDVTVSPDGRHAAPPRGPGVAGHELSVFDAGRRPAGVNLDILWDVLKARLPRLLARVAGLPQFPVFNFHFFNEFGGEGVRLTGVRQNPSTSDSERYSLT
jgi:hypothetical protein